MKVYFFGLMTLLVFSLHVSGQRYMTRTGNISFNASLPGSNDKARADCKDLAMIIDQDGACAMQMLIGSLKPIITKDVTYYDGSSFSDYITGEIDRYLNKGDYPKASLKGSITNFKNLRLSGSNVFRSTLIATIDLHGVQRNVKIPVKINCTGGVLTFNADFETNLDDFGITLSNSTRKNINTIVKTHINAELVQK